MISSLSPAQAKILDFYKKFMRKNRCAPSIRGVAEGLHREPSNVHYHLKNLEKAGLLVRTGGYRSVRLVNKESKLVPLVGVVSCGEPISILEETGDCVEIPSNMMRSGYSHYALRAKGDSMINAGIKSGDILVIRKQATVDDGDIAVVATGEAESEAATIKRVYRTKRALLLKPANDELQAYFVKRGEIRGKMIGVIRAM
ncbi:repressor LexA [Candidatus Peregrinibacteria bacterium]|nr:repressor LexA [Candidatus Peregrinibacteria bacterium]